ncbi:hypothetical protein ACFWIJ_04365 [Streptomyces sp. NPDC127079]|uniref:hypothetical protein n=1 Tax=Streptomyces sp. NPDC127079 TaxID=3347132 RepID=UPI0036630ACF
MTPEATPPQEDPAKALENQEKSLEQARLAQETKDERQVWYFLAYFLFGIHFIAFIMIYAVRHAK